ncbi:hypothetical protein [Flavivirga aquimarina]|uniref:hypothetical protein n=1 Tax=Flavivirga aquimarina TaxID=2027862 RepID=UPI0026DF1BBF|nr:hypothetical protein [Flavivirga aquimarina]
MNEPDTISGSFCLSIIVVADLMKHIATYQIYGTVRITGREIVFVGFIILSVTNNV